MKEFLQKYWIWIAIAIVVIVIVCVYLSRRKKSESGFEMPCADCGPGGMFGPAYAEAVEKAGGMDKWFDKREDELWKRAGELSMGLKGEDLKKAVQNAGGLIPYVQGREIAIKRIESATENLKDIINVPGVHGIGTMMGEYIGIRVLDENARKKAIEFIEGKKKEMLMFPGHGKGYMGYPVKIEITPMAKAL